MEEREERAASARGDASVALVVDANVFVAATRSVEARHEESYEFFRRAEGLGAILICPSIALPECAAAIARPTADEALAAHVVRWIQGLPNLRIVSLDLHLAREAAQVAVLQRLRGADSVYVAVAKTFNAALITWDTEVLERAPAAVPTSTPSDWVARQ